MLFSFFTAMNELLKVLKLSTRTYRLKLRHPSFTNSFPESILTRVFSNQSTFVIKETYAYWSR